MSEEVKTEEQQETGGQDFLSRAKALADELGLLNTFIYVREKSELVRESKLVVYCPAPFNICRSFPLSGEWEPIEQTLRGMPRRAPKEVTVA
jgi:hypothetical protein